MPRWDPKGRDLEWKLQLQTTGKNVSFETGTDVSLAWTVEAGEVNVNAGALIWMTSQADYRRHTK